MHQSDMIFKNPKNDYEEIVYTSKSPMYCFLFGGFFWAYKGIWKQAFLYIIFSLLTFGFSNLIYPFKCKEIIKTYFLRNGWLLTYEGEPIPKTERIKYSLICFIAVILMAYLMVQ